ncbi:MAG: tRNA pseudouridine(13) synthase TruD [Planctomycetes bacterium]|nr:tRNA pseudouridine(13) synthase TruD [Planctomycetota bacterium]
MLIKHKPEDFVVEELAEFTPSEKGSVSIYELKKKKLDTFEAVRRLAAKAKLPLDRIHYQGLKDRQGVTTQFISVDRGRLDPKMRVPGIWLRYLGRTDAPLTSDSLRGNAFRIVVRGLEVKDVQRCQERAARVVAHGLINYFDDQRFGSVVAGQGMVAKEMVRGNFEGAAKILLATPGKRDRLPDRRFKTLVQKTWGDWEGILRKWGNRRNVSMIRHLKRNPTDFAGAFQRLPAKERAIHVFGYQSLIWNESVAHYLGKLIPPHKRSSSGYAAGRHVWPELESDEPALSMPESWPLVDHSTSFEDPAVKRAVAQALAAEGLSLDRFRIRGIEGCFFKHYDRDLLVRPGGLRVSPPSSDDANEGKLKITIAFSLPPGSYATLVIKRLFGRAPARGDRPVSKGKRGDEASQALEEKERGKAKKARNRKKNKNKAKSKARKAKGKDKGKPKKGKPKK